MSLLRKGSIFLLLGVLLGSSCAFLAASLGASAVNGLVDSLFWEATGCHAHFEGIRFLPLQGKAKARDGRVVCGDVKAIEIPEASVSVKFLPLFSRRLALELEFSEGIIRGFLKDSALYRLIDFFVEQPPTPPEEWKVLVPRLVINNASVLEEFGREQILASKVNFELRDQEFGPLDLEVNVGKAVIGENVVNGEHKEEAPLGSWSAIMSVENKKFRFSKLDFINGNSRIRAKGQIDTAAENRIEGNWDFALNLPEAGFGEYSSGTIVGEGQIEGRIEEPLVQGRLRTDPNFMLKNPAEGFPEIMVEKSEAAFLVDFVDRAFRLSFNEGFVSSSGAKLSFNKPLQFTAHGFSGEIGLDFFEFVYGPLEIPSGEAALALSGSYADPEVKLTAELASLISAGVRFGQSALLAELSGRKLGFEASLKGVDGGEVLVNGSTTFFGSVPKLEDVKYTVSEMITPLGEGVGQEDERLVVRTSSSGTIEGELRADGFRVQGEFASVLDGLPVKDQFAGTIRAENGLLHLAAKNQNGEIEIRGKVPLIGESKAHIEADISNYDLSSFLPENVCANLSASGFYDFSTSAPTQGNGKILPTQLKLGCGQGALELVHSEKLLLNSGRLDFSRIRLASQGKQLEASGSYSIGGEAQIKLNGDFNLELLLPFLGMLDDLSGAVALEANLRVSDEIFQLDGKAELKQGALTLNSADVDVEGINGSFSFSPENVVIERIDAKINGGQLHASGSLNLQELQQSTLNTAFSRVELYPSESSHLMLSGDIRLETSEAKRPLVSGDVQIVRAEVKQQLESIQLIELLLKTLLSLEKNSTDKDAGSEPSALEEVDLEVNVRAEDSVYLISHWGAAELKADLSVVGRGNKPKISGKMETLSGWFGFRNRKFTISSGRISFKPGGKEPLLELYAQTTVRTPAAELVQVFLEAKGRVSNPKVSLSSDYGYSEQELLSLIAFAGDAVAEEAQSLVSVGILSNEKDADKEQMLGGVRQLVRKLTLLDSLVLEPAYDNVTGVVQPKLVAKKRLTDSINLRLEELYGETTGGSLVAVDYEASPKLTLSGRMEPATDGKEESLGVDASFIIEADSFGFLVLQLEGNDNVSRSAILEALKIGSRSALSEKEVPRLASELRDFYVKQGYFEAKVVAECQRGGDLCREVMLKISEGPLFVVGEVLLSGELGSEEKQLKKRIAKVKHEPASESVLQTLRLEMLKALRKRDYLQARVRVEYRDGGSREFKKLAAVDVDLGRPVYFSLSGNSFYSQKRLLTKAKVYDRELPFGRNSIRLLAEAILELYRGEGFADVSLTYQRAQDKSAEADHYTIEIKEGARIRVEAVELQGNNSLPTAKISQILKEKSKDLPQEFFSPTYLVLSELKRHESLLKQIYIEEGYPKAYVEHKIKRSDGGQKATVTFVVEEGKELLFASVEVLGFPEDIPLPPLPDDKITTMVVEEYRSLLESTLRDYGCVDPKVLLTESTEQRALISVSPGVRARVADVVISGRSYSREEAIRGNLLLGPGDYWISEKIRESRARLLRLGLFSRVEIGPRDGTLNAEEETLLVKVFEREPKVSSVGVGYDSVDGIRFFGEQTDRSLLGDGRSIKVKVDGFYDPSRRDISSGVASARYADPYVFGSSYRWTEDLRFLRLENDFLPFDTDRVSLGSYLDRKLSSRIDFGLGHSIFFEDLKSVRPDVVLGPYDSGQLRLSFLLANIVYTKYDDMLNPSRGFRLASYGRVASEVLASEASYATWGGRGAFVYTLPFAPSLSLANNTHGASSWPYGNSGSIPISQRFFLGGYSSVRGYKENSLGPRGVDGGCQGGDLMLLNNLEFRWQFYESFSLLTFLDVGGVYLRDKSVAVDELRSSTGFGFRYLSPVGPIGFDVGFPLERRSDEPSARFHFSIGTLF